MVALITAMLVALSGNLFLMTFSLMLLVSHVLLLPDLHHIGLAQMILFYFTVLAMPVASFIAAALVQKFALPILKNCNLPAFCLVLCCALGLYSKSLPDFFFAAKQITQIGSLFGAVVFITSVSNATLLCAALVALTLILIQLAFELPALWFSNALGFTRKPEISLRGLRMLGVLSFALIGSQLILSYLSTQLWPEVFLK